MEDLEEKISDEQIRKKTAEEKLQSRNKLLVGIRDGLDRLTDKLVGNILINCDTRCVISQSPAAYSCLDIRKTCLVKV